MSKKRNKKYVPKVVKPSALFRDLQIPYGENEKFEHYAEKMLAVFNRIVCPDADDPIHGYGRLDPSMEDLFYEASIYITMLHILKPGIPETDKRERVSKAITEGSDVFDILKFRSLRGAVGDGFCLFPLSKYEEDAITEFAGVMIDVLANTPENEILAAWLRMKKYIKMDGKTTTEDYFGI